MRHNPMPFNQKISCFILEYKKSKLNNSDLTNKYKPKGLNLFLNQISVHFNVPTLMQFLCVIGIIANSALSRDQSRDPSRR